MNKLKFMNNKEKKKILNILKDQFGFEDNLDYIFMINEKNKIYLTNADLDSIDIQSLKVNTFGLYVGELSGDEIRLSIEGSQLIGPGAKTNVLEVSEIDKRKWLKGEELYQDYPSLKFIIIKSGNDYLGCGKRREDRILNYVPKTRRLNCSD